MKRAYATVELYNNGLKVDYVYITITDNYKAVDSYEIADELVDEFDELKNDFDKAIVKVEDYETLYTTLTLTRTIECDNLEKLAEELEDFSYSIVQYNEKIERSIEFEADNYGLTIE